MNFLGWLTNSFTESSAGGRQPLPEKTLELAQKKFFDAIEREHTDDIERIAARYPNDFLKWTNEKGHSPLRVAQESDSLQSFISLVSLGADRHENYGNGWTPFTTALRDNDGVFTDYLLDAKVETLNSVAKSGEYSYTALHLAVLNRDAERVLRLIELGADQNIKTTPTKKSGEVTPAGLATQLKLPKIAEMLTLADDIREVKRRELTDLEAYAKAHTYVPKGDDPVAVPAAVQAAKPLKPQ